MVVGGSEFKRNYFRLLPHISDNTYQINKELKEQPLILFIKKTELC